MLKRFCDDPLNSRNKHLKSKNAAHSKPVFLFSQLIKQEGKKKRAIHNFLPLQIGPTSNSNTYIK